MAKLVVSDASSLILLQKIGLLDKLIKNFQFIIPQEVYNEAVIKGKLKKFNDSYQIENKVNKGSIKIKKIKDRNRANKIINEFGIAIGETEAIVLFLEIKGDVMAVDDHKSINICKLYQIPFIAALTFVIESCNRKLINKNEGKSMINDLGLYGRYKDELILKALNILEDKKWQN